MDGYSYLLVSGTLYSPRTASTALKAVLEGLLPPVAFVSRAVSTQSLLEKPYRIEELERLLAQEGMDYDTILLLARVFKELVSSPDMDTALFAAEGLNTLEGRYNEKIQLYQVLVEADPDPVYRKKLAFLYWELSGLNEDKRSIHNFYLREAFTQLRRIQEKEPLDKGSGLLMVRILLELELLGQAKGVLKKLDPALEDPDYLLLAAEIAYMERDVDSCCGLLEKNPSLRDLVGEVDQDAGLYRP
jgi:tetratricopeptide (TPR) repeat protein